MPLKNFTYDYQKNSKKYILLCLLCIFGVFVKGAHKMPSFAEPIPNITVTRGRDVTLTCVVNNLGDYKVAWIHINRQMILTVHNHIISRVPGFTITTDDQITWKLTIYHVTITDHGYYMCQVNSNPMITQVGYLQVVVPPTILDNVGSPTTLNFKEGVNVSLVCIATGFPKPSLTWKREDGGEIAVDRRNKVMTKFYLGGVMNITYISRVDMGVYFCIASNGVPPAVSKRYVVSVVFPPIVNVPNQLLGAPLGGNVTIECITEAYPPALDYWLFDSGMVYDAIRHNITTIKSRYITTLTLQIDDVEPSDFGTYRCISKNSIGEAEATVRIHEINVGMDQQGGMKDKGEETNEIAVPSGASGKNTLTKSKSDSDGNNAIAKGPTITTIGAIIGGTIILMLLK